jgi:hypothetical protein
MRRGLRTLTCALALGGTSACFEFDWGPDDGSYTFPAPTSAAADAGVPRPPQTVVAVDPDAFAPMESDASSDDGRCKTTAGSGQEPLIDDFEDGDLLIAHVDGRQGATFAHGEEGKGVTLSLTQAGARSSAHATRLAGSASFVGAAGMITFLAEATGACPYDARRYVGVEFWARTDLESQVLEIVTATAAHASCGALVEPWRCEDQYIASVTLGPQWQHYELLWQDFTGYWPASNPGATDAAPSLEFLYSLELRPAAPLDSFAFLVDDLALMVGPCDGTCDPARPCPGDCCGDSRCQSFEVARPIRRNEARTGFGSLYCAADCPLETGSCPERALGNSLPLTTAGTTALARDQLHPSCLDTGELGAPEVAYLFSAPREGTYSFRLESESGNVLYVLSGACTGEELGCRAESAVDGETNLTLSLAADQQVTLVIDSVNATGSPFELTIESCETGDADAECR